jgi:dipeptidyl aminopeptidase/acylaminoacyl peptidase
MNKRTSGFLSGLVAIVVALTAFRVDGQPKPQTLRRESPGQRHDPYFTVTDSIEMTRFEGEGGEPIFSPDKRYFAVVTSRGIVQSDQVESTLWVFRADDVRKFLATDVVPRTPAPRMVARLAATPRGNYNSSYQPVISNRSIRWAPDSSMILFLGQNSEGKRQLYRANLGTGSVRALTPEQNDVSKFDFIGNAIIYRAASSTDNREEGYLVNADARDVAGIPFGRILFPKTETWGATYSEMGLIRNGRNSRIRDPDTNRPLRLLDFPGPDSTPLSISPDGQSAVVLLPSKAAPRSWESYEPGDPLIKKIHPEDPNATAESNVLRPTEYALVDLTSGRVTQLLNAPHGWALGYDENGLAIWSSDGKKLLLTNTFLPLDGADQVERLKRLRPCTAVVVDVVSRAAACVAFYQGKASELQSAAFGDTDNDIILQSEGASAKQQYRLRDGSWQLGASPPINQPVAAIDPLADPSQMLSVQIRQDLNTPAALWATDQKTKRSKRIWDPNPQLARMDLGEVAVFHWKDKAGFEWTGGLVKPPDYVPGKRYPLVIQTHGFAEHEFMTDGNFATASAARPLAAAGIVVLQVMDRFDGENTADEASNRVLGFESAMDQLVADGLVDPKRVGIIGFSRTCYHVESALIHDPKRFAAATIADGVDESYLQELLYFTVGVPYHGGEAIYGAKPFGEGLRENWVQRAPGFHLDRIQTPVRIEAISAGRLLGGWEIYASLTAQVKPVDLIYYPSGQHILQKPLERLASQQGNVDWFRFWLKGEEDPDPAKREQYIRWSQLRKLHEELGAAR